uniref:Uncharacterized protein n=1 Tax=Tanacetum cinerariifolium TaxID=118510 RepID=A0A6L2N4C8_TANCI|nr:hypothetical protein [Tanacetum cinerariifolium]
MIMEQYLTHTDYAFWEVIMNGDAPASIASVSGGAKAAIPPKTIEQKITRRNELKAKSTMLLAIPDEHLLKFHGIKDAKTLWEAIKTRFQKLISQLEIHGEVILQEDANLKLLRSLPPAWNNHTLIMRNKSDLDTLSMDDLYNNLSTNEAVNTAHNISTASSQGQTFASTYADDVMFSFFANQSNSPKLDNKDLEQIDTDNLEEMDLKWIGHFARECKAPRSQGNRNGDNTRRVVPVETPANALVVTDGIGYNWSYQAEKGPTNFALMAFSSSSSSNSDTETGLGYGSQLNERDLNNKSDVFESASDSSMNESEEYNNQANDMYKTGEGYRAVPHPYTGNFMPPIPNLSLARLDDFVFKSAISETITFVHETKTSTSKNSKESMEKPKIVRPSALIIKDWESDSDDDCELRPLIEQNKPSHAKINFVKSNENTRKYVIEQHTYKQAGNLGKSQNSRVDKRDWNGMITQKLRDVFELKKKACFVCESLYHLIKDLIINSRKVPVNAAKQISPRAISSTSTARYVNTTANRPTENGTKPSLNVFHKSHSPIQRTFNQRTTPKNSDLKETVNTVKVNNVTIAETKAVVSVVQGNKENVVNSSACWIWRPTRNVIDHISKDSGSYMLKRFNYVDLQGRLKHMIGNKSFFTNYQEIDEGFAAFRGSPKGGKISSKGKIRTGKLDFEDVYFVKELKFNLFSVSQMCDKKNIVLFTETKCLILSFDFKLLDENQVLLKVLRQNNMSLNLDLMKPFEYHITILNTLDHLGKFKGKADEGFLVGYSVNSKAFRVFNFRTKRVKENLHIKILENKSNVVGRGPEWLFDIDSLTKSMNYEPVITGNQTNNDACIEIHDNAGKARHKKASDHEYILLPFMPSNSPLDADEVPDKGDKCVNKGSEIDDQEKTDNSTQDINTDGPSINTANTNINTGSPNINIVGPNDPKPKKVIQALADLSWIEATQEEILQFKLQKIDVKSAFLYGIIEKEVYVYQPPGFEDPYFPNKVYKVEKAVYGLHQAPRAWYETMSTYLLENGFRRGLQVKQKYDRIFISQDKYVADILKKFDFATVKTASTSIKPNKALIKDAEAKDVDGHLYRSMIGSLMYLTASRPDIMFVVCACARFQVTPNTSHLHAVKRIFRYLKGKKQTIVANSTIEAEYVAAANCCRQTANVIAVDNGEQQIIATINGKEFTITKAFVRRHL